MFHNRCCVFDAPSYRVADIGFIKGGFYFFDVLQGVYFITPTLVGARIKAVDGLVWPYAWHNV